MLVLRNGDGAVFKQLIDVGAQTRGLTSSFEQIGDGGGISSFRDCGIDCIFRVNLNDAINKGTRPGQQTAPSATNAENRVV